MLGPNSIKTHRYLDPAEIIAHLDGVEYIVMATPSPEKYRASPIHFSIFLNTAEKLPEDIEKAVFEKFCEQYGITDTAEYMGGVGLVGFAETDQDTPMPMWLIKIQDQRSIPGTLMFVMDFLGDSADFTEVKVNQMTGWTYSYN